MTKRGLQKALWDAINVYTESCGGDPSAHVNSAKRMAAVFAVERLVEKSAVGLQATTARQKEAIRRLSGLRVGQEVYLLTAKTDEGSHGVDCPVIFPHLLACIPAVIDEIGHDTVTLLTHGAYGEYDPQLVLVDPGPYPVERD